MDAATRPQLQERLLTRAGDARQGTTTMKITKKQLQQIVKEELGSVLAEIDQRHAQCHEECRGNQKCIDNCLSPPKADEKPTDEPKQKTTDSTPAGIAKDPAEQHLLDYYNQMYERKGRRGRK